MSINFQQQYVLPTPAGAYACIVSEGNEAAKLFMQQLMNGSESRLFDKQLLDKYLAVDAKEQEDILFHMQKLKWIQGFEKIQYAVSGAIEDVFPDILQKLSSEGKALLADDQGFYLAGAGFKHEACEELSALSGDLSSLYARHQGIVKKNLNINSAAFALVDAAGYSQLGFWPLYVGDLQFMLVISGVPRFDQNAFVNLIWSLHQRYYISEASLESDAA